MIGYYLKHSLVRIAAGAAGIRVVALVSGLGVSIILARELGPEGYGTYGFAVSVLTMAALCLHAGMPAFILREMVRLRVDDNWAAIRGIWTRVQQWIGFGAIALIGLFAALWLWVGDAEAGSTYWYLLVASPLMPLIALNSTRAAMLRGFKKVIASQVAQNLVQPTTQLLLLFAAVYFVGVSVQSALITLVISTLLAVLAASFFVRRYLVVPDNVEPEYQTGSWVRALMPFSILAAVSIGNTQAATLIMGLVSSREEISYLRIAERISQLVGFSLLIVNLVSAPHLAERAKKGQWQELQTLAVRSARGALLIAVPIALFLVIFGQPLIGLLFGQTYAQPVWLPLVIICLGQLCNLYFGSVANVLNMAGLEKETLRGVSLGLLVNLAITSVLAVRYGAVGAAIGFSVSMLLWNVYLSLQVKRKLAIRVSAF